MTEAEAWQQLLKSIKGAPCASTARRFYLAGDERLDESGASWWLARG